MSARVRRSKPYVCVDCDFAEHFRFQATKDIDAAAGVWLRCLAHSRAQEQDGRVTLAWLRRNFATSFHRVEELVAVGLLRLRFDGDYEIHAYAPRNQTRAMLVEARKAARKRMRAIRKRVTDHPGGEPVVADAQAPSEGQDAPAAGPIGDAGGVPRPSNVRPNAPANGAIRNRFRVDDRVNGSLTAYVGARVSTPRRGSSMPIPPSPSVSSDSACSVGKASPAEEMSTAPEGWDEEDAVTPSERACSERPVRANSAVTRALVPTSTSTSIFNSLSSSSDPDLHNATEIHRGHEGEDGEGAWGEAGGGRPAEHGGVTGAATSGRRPLPPSERRLWGSTWLEAFTAGVTAHTGRPCTAAPMYLTTLERIVSHHAPQRDAVSACAFLRSESEAFARLWDGKHPAKGLTPDGLERWLNDGRHGPPEFGKQRILQLPAEEWHEDDWSDLGATVLK